MRISCIYKICSLVEPSRVYVGSAVDYVRRKELHIKMLAKGNHHSIVLQRHVNSYGLSDLRFSIIERVFDRNELIKREQFHMDQVLPFFNICKTAGSSLGTKHSEKTKALITKILTGKKQSAETIQKRISKVKGQKRTAEMKALMSVSAMGRVVKDSTKEKLRISSRAWMENGGKAIINRGKIGKNLSEDHRKKISIAGKGRVVTDEAKRKISLKNKGSKRTDEARLKMRNSQLGKKQTAEVIKKKSDSLKLYHALKNTA